ncbi:UNVERIFIED_CONTAM: hypothetical protein GTU68_001301 [Idotea baltica]|nr:hypothetical protein [Idotea baltica]
MSILPATGARLTCRSSCVAPTSNNRCGWRWPTFPMAKLRHTASKPQRSDDHGLSEPLDRPTVEIRFRSCFRVTALLGPTES